MTHPALSRRRFLGQFSSAVAATALAPAWARAVGAAPAESGLVPPRKLGVALVGLGGYSRGQLGPALRETQHCRLAGVVTGDPAKGARWASEYGFSEKAVYGYDTMARLADNPEIDIVYVVTPPGLHAEHSIAAAKAGKHVICEKPMARTVAECDAIIAACQAAGVQLAIGYRLHFEPHHLEFARLARDPEFGPFMQVRSSNGYKMGNNRNWRISRELAGGGPLMDMGIYSVQAMCTAMREQAPIAITAEFPTPARPDFFNEVEESVRWSAEFADGAKGEGFSSYNENIATFRAEGPKGWAEIPRPTFSYRGQSLVTSRGPVPLPSINQQAAQMDGTALCFFRKQPNPVPGEMGRRDLAIIEAIYRAARSGRSEEVKLGA